jgi:hypothetical protein
MPETPSRVSYIYQLVNMGSMVVTSLNDSTTSISLYKNLLAFRAKHPNGPTYPF